MVKVNPVSSFEHPMLYTKFKVIGFLVPKKEMFQGFYHIRAWKPSWSCEPEHLNNIHPNRRLHMKFGFKWPSVFLGKEVWKWWKAPCHLASNGLVFFLGKEVWKCKSEWTSTKVIQWPWPGVVLNRHVLIYLTICTNFPLTGFNSFLEITA